jgi:hypothetical protein
LLCKFRPLPFVHQRIGQLPRDFPRKPLLGQRHHAAIRLDGGRKIIGDEQVRAPGFPHRRHQLVHVGAGLFFVET